MKKRKEKPQKKAVKALLNELKIYGKYRKEKNLFNQNNNTKKYE